MKNSLKYHKFNISNSRELEKNQAQAELEGPDINQSE